MIVGAVVDVDVRAPFSARVPPPMTVKGPLTATAPFVEGAREFVSTMAPPASMVNVRPEMKF